MTQRGQGKGPRQRVTTPGLTDRFLNVAVEKEKAARISTSPSHIIIIIIFICAPFGRSHDLGSARRRGEAAVGEAGGGVVVEDTGRQGPPSCLKRRARPTDTDNTRRRRELNRSARALTRGPQGPRGMAPKVR